MSLLSLRGVNKVFGGLHAIKEVSFEVEPGSIFGLIGPNGAGKTTLFNVITGVYRPDGGDILLDGESIAGLRPSRIAEHGVARTFQNIRLFRSMTVAQNVMVAGHHLHQCTVWDMLFRTRAFARDEAMLKKRAGELLELFGLASFAEECASNLPYGSQRRLEIARALLLEPKVLLLDEPAAGMNSQEAQELEQQLRFLRDQRQLSLILVEHNMSVVLSVCDRVHVVDHGETLFEGAPDEVKTHPKVLAAYLGQEDPGEGA